MATPPSLSLFLLIFLFSEGINVVSSGVSRSDAVTVLSKGEIEEITMIAEKSLEKELEKSSEYEDYYDEEEEEDESQPEFEERPPPEVEDVPDVIGGLEEIKRNISSSPTAVECNITAEYLWELCRPVLLKTCKKNYRTQCRSSPRKFRVFSRRLNHMFPLFRPPKVLFKPQPLFSWIDDLISQMKQNANNTNFQISLTIVNNNQSKTYNNEDFVNDIARVTENFHRTMDRIRSEYDGFMKPFLTFSTNTERQRGRSYRPFSNWMQNHFRNREEKGRAEEVPASRVEIKGERPKSNPSIRIPKSLPKKYRRGGVRSTREKRSPGHRPYYRRTMRRPHGPRPWNQHRDMMRRMMGDQHHHMNQHMPKMWQNMGPMMAPRFHYGFPRYPPFHGTAPRLPFVPTYHHPTWMGNPYQEYWSNSDGDNEEDEEEPQEEEEEVTGFEITCEQMDENPEICLEIAERTEKCENELEEVCPEYMQVRRQIQEKLSGAQPLSRLHEITQFARTNGNVSKHEIREKHEWETRGKENGRPIVIESISINEDGSGDAHVRARIFDSMEVKLRVPSSDFDSTPKSLGKAISKMALKRFMEERAKK